MNYELGKTKIIFFLFFFFGIFGLVESLQAATYYVAANGNDSNVGTSAAPFKTIQKAADVVLPGDNVIVNAGVYNERVLMKTSGVSGKPIVFEGVPGAIIDGGTKITGWDPAPEIGVGVYKHSGWPWVPQNMTWNNKYILQIKDSKISDGSGAALLKKSATDSAWDGVEAWFGNSGGTTYVRFRNGQDPDNENVTFAPKNGPQNRGVITIYRSDFITVRGFTIRNAYYAVLIEGLEDNPADDNIIEENTLIGGTATVYVARGARNHIRDNKITLDYIYADLGHPRSRSAVDYKIWGDFKNQSVGDRTGVVVISGGSDNQIYNNEIYRHFDGINHTTYFANYDGTVANNRDVIAQYNQRLKIYGNTLRNLHDSGIEAVDGGVEVEWHDNLVYEATTNLRIKSVTKGPLYIYRNRVANDAQTAGPGTSATEGSPIGVAFNASVNMDPNTPGKVYFYHNTLAVGYEGIRFSSTADQLSNLGLPNFWFINNILSSDRSYLVTNFPNGVKSHADYNWVGGSGGIWTTVKNNIIAIGQSLWPDRSKVDFQLVSNSPVIDKGIDLSKSWTVDGVTHPALPGMSAGYFKGTAPDLGAYEYQGNTSTDTTPPASPTGLKVN